MINKKENEYIVSFVRIDVIHVTVNAVDDVVAKDVATSIAKSGYGDKSIKIGKSRVVRFGIENYSILQELFAD